METKEQQTKKIQDGQYESSANSRFTIKSHRRKELYFGTLQREVYPSSTWDQREVYPSSTWDGGC